MKNLILGTAAVIVLGSSLAIADSERGGRGMERLQSALGLSAEQSTQVESLMQQHRQQMEALRQQLEQNMQGVLSAEQFAQFQQMQQHRGRGRGGRGGRPPQGQYQNNMPAQ